MPYKIRFSIITPTPGRPEVKRLLESIKAQPLGPDDEMLLLGDGEQPEMRRLFVESGIQGRYFDVPKIHKFRFPPRNAGMEKSRGSHLWFFDDRDVMPPGSLSIVRDEVEKAPDRIHIFSALLPNGKKIPRVIGEIVPGIDTDCFIVPAKLKARWKPRRLDDFTFLRDAVVEVSRAFPKPPIWHPEVIALIKPSTKYGAVG